MKYGEMAFPGIEIRGTGTAQTRVYHRGMSLRDWFAGQALAECIRDEGVNDKAAKEAYSIADAMIWERAKHE